MTMMKQRTHQGGGGGGGTLMMRRRRKKKTEWNGTRGGRLCKTDDDVLMESKNRFSSKRGETCVRAAQTRRGTVGTTRGRRRRRRGDDEDEDDDDDDDDDFMRRDYDEYETRFDARNARGSGSGRKSGFSWENVRGPLLAGAFAIGLGSGVALTSSITFERSNIASTEIVDRKSPSNAVCIENGYSAIVMDQRVFVSFNPYGQSTHARCASLHFFFFTTECQMGTEKTVCMYVCMKGTH